MTAIWCWTPTTCWTLTTIAEDEHDLLRRATQIVTSYRNSKNYGDNWITAGYALWFLRESPLPQRRPDAVWAAQLRRQRHGLPLLPHGSSEKCGGWNFFLLTEDIQFTICQCHPGREGRLSAPTAVLYDEQPTTFRQSWRQRLRWSRGLPAGVRQIRRVGLFRGIFRGSFSCYDMTMNIMPAFLLTVALIVSYLVVRPVRPRAAA